MGEATYVIEGNTLYIRGRLASALDVKFDVKTEELLEKAAAEGLTGIVIDLRGLDTMQSQYIGALGAVSSEMKSRGGDLTVRARSNVGELLCQCGMDRMLTLEV